MSARGKVNRTHYLWHLLMAMCMLATPQLWAEDSPPDSQPDGAVAVEDIRRIDPQTFVEYLADNYDVTLIDARSPDEYATSHLPGAINIPFDQVDDHIQLLPANPVKPVLVYCRTGRRASILKKELDEQGYSDVQVIPGYQIITGETDMAFNCGNSETPRACQ